MMDTFPASWSEIFEEMLPRNECDICRPPLDIGPPPPLPANFQDKAILSGSCNVCSVLSDVEMRPIQVTDASLLPVAATFVVGILFVLITVIVLLLKIKKCQAFMPHVCWIFPRNVLPHTELAPSSLPSPSPSMEKLKDSGKRQWHMSSRSLQSENIYEVCSPPSPDSLYEEVGPGPRSECSPYGVVMVENSLNALNQNGLSRGGYGSQLGQDCLAGSRFQPSIIRNILPNSRFSTFGGSAHGFVNPVVQDGHVTSSQTLRSSFRPRNAAVSAGTGGYVQKRELPPVPGDNF